MTPNALIPPSKVQHYAGKNGWHLIYCPEAEVSNMIFDPPANPRFDWSKNPQMSFNKARRVIRWIADASPALKQAYIDLLEGKGGAK